MEYNNINNKFKLEATMDKLYNELENLFYKDLKEKSFVKPCSYNTDKEDLSRMCKQSRQRVPCETINLNKPYTLKELKFFGKDLQKLYFEHVFYTYNPSNKELCDMLKMSGAYADSTLSHYLSRIGCAPRKRGKSQKTIEQFTNWGVFLRGGFTDKLESDTTESSSKNTEVINKVCVNSIKSELVGNQQDIISTISTLFELLTYSEKYQVNIEIKV